MVETVERPRRRTDTTRHVTDPRFHIGPMDEFYDLVFRLIERRYDSETRSRFDTWLRSVKPTTAHLAVMMVSTALSGRPMGERHLVLAGFSPDGEPLIDLVQ
jgi:hypothetical protein